MHNFERVVIDTLHTYGLKAYQREDYPGAWVDNTKICAIEVRTKKFITFHELAFNVKTDKSYFNLINPCGITDFKVSLLEDFVNKIDIEKVKNDLTKSYENIFSVDFKELYLEVILNE